MSSKKILSLIFSVLMSVSWAQAQNAEVTVSLNEQFFDKLLDAIFTNLKQPEFALAKNENLPRAEKTSLISALNGKYASANYFCDEKIILLRQDGDTKTGAQFRNGKIYAPIAFTGTYSPPLIGCMDFRGHAETNIELYFDRDRQTLYGRVKVLDVKLGSVANLAGGFIARIVQNSIDRKINPIEILSADKLAFVIPVQNSGGALRMRATDIRHEVGEGVLNVHINFEFEKVQ